MPLRGGPDPERVRLVALIGVVAFVVALPLTVASAGPAGDAGPGVVRTSVRVDQKGRVGEEGRVREQGRVDGKGRAPGAAPAPAASPRRPGPGPATAARCGPALSSPDGIEAQTCVLTRGADTWARTYYRNATGDELSSVLSLMGPGGRTVQMHCVVATRDDPGACETPRERTAGGAGAYTAVAEFARRSGDGPLLLRSGSSSGN